MNLAEYDGKYVRVRDTYGNDFAGRASYGSVDLLKCEWGMDEDGVFIEDNLICSSQIESIEEIVPHGTAELRTEHLVLRRYRPDDAEQLYQQFGTDPEMYKYSGWNPYGTLEMTQDAVRRFIESYKTVLAYLTKNEGISCVTAWCAAENIGSRKVLEKSGMQLVNTEKDGLIVDGRVYDKMIYEYRHS